MNERALRELTLSGLRVYVYCLLKNKERYRWNGQDFTKFLDMEYKAGTQIWKNGVLNLIENGFVEKTDDPHESIKFKRMETKEKEE